MRNEITSTEAIEMMNRCKHELMRLRREVEFLRPKAEAYDNLATILRLLPPRSVEMSEDLILAAELYAETPFAWQLLDGTKKEWVSKLQVERNSDGTWTMPLWLAKEKEFI